MHVPGGGSALEPEAHHPHRGAVGRRAAAGLPGIAESGHRHACERRGLLRGCAGASRLPLHRFRHRIQADLQGRRSFQRTAPHPVRHAGESLPAASRTARLHRGGPHRAAGGTGGEDRVRAEIRPLTAAPTAGHSCSQPARSRFAAALSGQEGPGRPAWRSRCGAGQADRQVPPPGHLELGQSAADRSAASLCGQ